MINREQICCFTGHRSLSAEQYRSISILIRSVITDLYNKGYRVFISGAARGFDTYAASTVAAMRSELYGIYLWLAVPYRNHDHKWVKNDREYFGRLQTLCDKEFVLSEKYYRQCYYYRNMWMTDRSSVIIAYYDGRTIGSGTANTVAYAAANGLHVINLPDLLNG